MRKKDVSRKWLWYFLAVLAISQLYWVRELLAAFALFVLLFAALGSVIAALYLFQKAWEAGVVRLAKSQNRWVLAARRNVASLEELARRPLRRPGSQPTQA